MHWTWMHGYHQVVTTPCIFVCFNGHSTGSCIGSEMHWASTSIIPDKLTEVNTPTSLNDKFDRRTGAYNLRPSTWELQYKDGAVPGFYSKWMWGPRPKLRSCRTTFRPQVGITRPRDKGFENRKTLELWCFSLKENHNTRQEPKLLL